MIKVGSNIILFEVDTCMSYKERLWNFFTYNIYSFLAVRSDNKLIHSLSEYDELV